jgi:hypothetical protein
MSLLQQFRLELNKETSAHMEEVISCMQQALCEKRRQEEQTRVYVEKQLEADEAEATRVLLRVTTDYNEKCVVLVAASKNVMIAEQIMHCQEELHEKVKEELAAFRR